MGAAALQTYLLLALVLLHTGNSMASTGSPSSPAGGSDRDADQGGRVNEPSLTDIAAARRDVQRKEEGLLKNVLLPAIGVKPPTGVNDQQASQDQRKGGN